MTEQAANTIGYIVLGGLGVLLLLMAAVFKVGKGAQKFYKNLD